MAVYSPVAFLHLNPPNHMGKERLLLEVAHFLQHFANYTKCHLHCVRGYELVNPHEHVIVSVPAIEQERFLKRLSTFDASRVWRWKYQLDAYDLGRHVEAYGYVQKHEFVLPSDSPDLFCPKQQHQCRKGACKHITHAR